MADVAKPTAPAAEPVVAPAAEPVTAPATTETPAAPATETPAAPATTPAAAEPTVPAATSAEPGQESKVEEPAAAAAPAVPAKDDAKEAAPVKEEAKPVYEGTLQYNAGSTIKSFIGLKEKLFFFYGEEAVSSDKLSHLLKPTKTELKETIAWSHQTGKGLLYYVKHADHKANPKGVIGLAEVEELKPVGTLDINFKLHGHKHLLVAESKSLRDGWLLSLEEKIAEAKSLKENIHSSSGFKEQVEKLGKPAVVAAAVVKTSESTPKKSSEEAKDAKAERTTRAETTDAKKAANKDRSQSRGKRLLDTIRGKKEGDAAKTEEVKAAEETPAVPAVAAAAPIAAEETSAAEPAAVAVESAEEQEGKPEELRPNKARRGSKFFDRIKGAVSPSTEKKADEVIPETSNKAAGPATSDAAPVLPLTETSKATEEAPAAAATTEAAAPAAEEPVVAAEVPKIEDSDIPAIPPKDEKRRSSFFSLGALRKPSEKKITKEDSKAAEEPVKAEETTPEAAKAEEVSKPVEDETPAGPVAADAAETPAKEAKATTPKTEKKENALTGIKRSLSKALYGGDKAKKDKTKPAKVENVKEEAAAEAPAEKSAAAEVPATTEAAKAPETKEETAAPAAIGDVVPEAVNIGTPAAPPASTTVQATA